INDLLISFISTLPPPLLQKRKQMLTQKFVNALFGDDEIEPISDDEIYVNQIVGSVKQAPSAIEEISDDEQYPRSDWIQCQGSDFANDIKLIIHNDDQVKSVDDRERQPSTPLHKYAHQHRTKEARRRRNHIRNNTFLMRRFRYCIKYNIHYQFKMKLIKAILRQNEIKHTHVKVVDGLLIIGFRHDMLKQQDQHHHHHHHRHHEHHREQ
ncbi:unnamed protein product, partial [Rotaria magnacalcarata]